MPNCVCQKWNGYKFRSVAAKLLLGYMRTGGLKEKGISHLYFVIFVTIQKQKIFNRRVACVVKADLNN